MSVLATRYATSLLSLAIEKNKVSEYREEINLIKDSFDDANIIKFFESRKVSKQEKKDLCKQIFADKVDKYVLNFLFVLIDKGRIINYQEIFTEFYHLCCEEMNIKEGIIETVRPLDKTLIKELEETLSNDSQRVELKEKINKSLISGFKISFADKVIDNSMKSKITNMEERLKRKDGRLWN